MKLRNTFLLGMAYTAFSIPTLFAADFEYLPLEGEQTAYRPNQQNYYNPNPHSQQQSPRFGQPQNQSPTFGQTQNQPPPQMRKLSPTGNWQPGNEWLQALLIEYKSGNFNNFLSKNDSLYQESKQSGEYNELVKSWSNQTAIFSSKEGKQVADSFNKLFDKTKRELSTACEGQQADQKVCHAVNSISHGPNITPAQKDALNWLNQLVLGLIPANQGDQNIKNILVEYRLKRLEIEPPQESGEVPHSFAEKELAVLELDKYNKLFEAARGNAEQSKKINDAYQGFLNMAQSQHDMRYLIDLGRNTRQPSNPAEQKVAQVMSNYVNELKQLHQQEMAQRGPQGMQPRQQQGQSQNQPNMPQHMQAQPIQNQPNMPRHMQGQPGFQNY